MRLMHVAKALKKFSKAKNPLKSLFVNGAGSETERSHAFNWDNHGIRHPYVIFITGRCGSTLLAGLIKETNLAGNPAEYFNPGLASQLSQQYAVKTLAGYLENIISSSASNGNFGIQIDWHQLRHLDQLIDFKRIFSTVNTTFFFMTRRDLVAQGWSYASAKQSGEWQKYSRTQDSAALNSTPSLTDECIWREILLILEAEMRLEKFFEKNQINPMRIDYEMLMTSRRDVLASVLLAIGCDVESIVERTEQMTDHTLKLTRNQFASMLAFRNRHAQLISEAEGVRGRHYRRIRRRLRQQGIRV